MALLKLKLLGHFEVEWQGQVVTRFGSVKTRTLLAYLALEGEQTRPALLALFWPEEPEAAARQNLRQTLYQLRRALAAAGAGLEQPWLHTDSQSIRLQPELLAPTDAALFSQAQQNGQYAAAVRYYRGRLLDDIRINDSAALEEWLVTLREYYQRLALEALYRLAQDALQQGRFAEAAELAQRQTAMDGWREEAYAQWMRALALQGKRSEALAQYRKLTRRLESDLGVGPSPQVNELHQQIRSNRLRPEPAQTISPTTGRLPTPPTTLIGRAGEQARLLDQLAQPECRLLTIYGMGGLGKTRLAIQAAHALAQRRQFADGVWFVTLEERSDAHAAPSQQAESVALAAIANTLGLAAANQAALERQLSQHLATRRLLLVLDNCEHILEGLVVISRLLAASPGLKVLATAREPLELIEEWLLPLEGLPTPAPGDEDIERFPSVSLFVQRARQVNPQFELTPADRPAVAEICRLVEGMPLALELAATWLRGLTCAEIQSSIQRGLQVFAASWRNILPRHANLSIVFEQSWQRLTPAQQHILTHVSVFQGGFSAEAAHFVGAATSLELTLLTARALLRRSPDGRYSLHELLRQFIAEKRTLEPGLENTAANKHSQWYLTQALPRYAANYQHAGSVWSSESENLRRAWLHALNQTNSEMLRCSLPRLCAFFFNAGRLEELHQLLQASIEMLQLAGPGLAGAQRQLLLGETLAYLADIYYRRYRYQDGAESAAQALQLARQQHDPALESLALIHLGFNQVGANAELARQTLLQAQSLAESLENPLLQAKTFSGLAYVENYCGNHRAQQNYLERALPLFRQAGEKALEATDLCNLGKSYYHLGRYAQARQILEQALTLSAQIGDQRSQAFSLLNLGMVADYQGNYGAAVDYYHRAEQISSQIGYEIIQWAASANLSTSLAYIGQYRQALEQAQAALRFCSSPDKQHNRASLLMMMAFYHTYLEEFTEAVELGQQALELAQTLSDPSIAAYVQDALGHALSGLGDLPAAGLAYQRSLELKQDGAIPHTLVETVAGLARLSLSAANPVQALSLLEPFLPALLERLPEGLEDPFAVYQTAHQTLLALGDPRAEPLAQCATGNLMQRAQNITNAATRQTFLYAIRSNYYFAARLNTPPSIPIE